MVNTAPGKIYFALIFIQEDTFMIPFIQISLVLLNISLSNSIWNFLLFAFK